jgi:hypothetical protein
MCSAYLDAPPWPGERICAKCEILRPQHRVLMNFMERDGWFVSFLEADCMTSLPRTFTFTDAGKILEMARRGGANMTSASKADIQTGLNRGRGGIWLNLTPAQYAGLKK